MHIVGLQRHLVGNSRYTLTCIFSVVAGYGFVTGVTKYIAVYIHHSVLVLGSIACNVLRMLFEGVHGCKR